MPGQADGTGVDAAATQDFGAAGATAPDAGTYIGEPSDITQSPYTSEFKSDLASQLSMDLSGVSQFFKDGIGGDKTRNIAVGVGVMILLIAGFLLFKTGSSGDSGDDSSVAALSDEDDYEADGYDDEEDELYDEDSDDSEDLASEDEDEFSADQSEDYDSDSGYGYGSESSGGGPELTLPLDGQRRNYDETSEYAVFEWSGAPGGTILFARNPEMSPLEKKIQVSGNSYALAHPWPGVWYWQVENEEGLSEVSRFHVDPPMRRNVQLMAMGSTLSGTGGVVSWQGDSKVARYMLEMSQSGWSNPQWRFQTSSTSITLSGVTSGAYKLRVGAFSEVAGRWEYSSPVDVTVE